MILFRLRLEKGRRNDVVAWRLAAIFEKSWRPILLMLVLLCTVSNAAAQTTAFTYQGQLKDNGNPANGNYDFQFKLFDTATVGTGTQQGSMLSIPSVPVTAGGFTVQLDFGAAVFPGAPRFLEISVKPAGGPTFTVLAPRQPVNATPYALRSVTAATTDTATNATQLGGLAASGFIQNTTTQQAATDFNIGGTGKANIFDATTQFNLNGNRVLSNPGTNNLFVGVNAGASNTTGINNSFFGTGAGQTNSTGGSHSFFGAGAGKLNTASCCNSFFGTSAGTNNTTGSSNSFFGSFSGENNSTGILNSFFGNNAGQANTAGNSNSFFGESSGNHNTTGGSNVFFGTSTGFANTTGAGNSFFGAGAGLANTTGNNNTLIGAAANVGANNLSFATAIGAQAVVSTNNTIALGRNADTVQIPGALNVVGTGTASIFNATTQFNIAGSRILSNPGISNMVVGINAGQAITTGSSNAFFGELAGTSTTAGSSNSFFGIGAGLNNTTGTNNTFIGTNAGTLNPSTQVNNSIAIGSGVTLSTSNTIVLGTTAHTTRIPGFLNVVDLGSGNFAMQVVTSPIGGGVVGNNLYVRQLNQTGSPAHLCWKVSPDGVPALLLTVCTTALSSVGNKTEVQPFSGGLEVINRLRPVAFKWKADGASDVGLNAEEVAEVEPLLVTRNAKGEVEDVKEGGLTVLFINAFKQQQAQIKLLQQEIETLKRRQQEFDALKSLVCATHPEAAVCKSN